MEQPQKRTQRSPNSSAMNNANLSVIVIACMEMCQFQTYFIKHCHRANGVVAILLVIHVLHRMQRKNQHERAGMLAHTARVNNRMGAYVTRPWECCEKRRQMHMHALNSIWINDMEFAFEQTTAPCKHEIRKNISDYRCTSASESQRQSQSSERGIVLYCVSICSFGKCVNCLIFYLINDFYFLTLELNRLFVILASYCESRGVRM